jgi:peptidoglycan hydrolase-like protein with peptidoglycan-binding domain
MNSLRTFSFGQECSLSNPPDAGGDKISSPVGENARNLPEDARTVQRLLNGTPSADGGPGKPLVVDGIAGPKTNAAIRQFQSRHFGRADGRIDPEGPTLQKLRALNLGGGLSGQAGPTTPGVAPSGDTTLRLATAILVQPEVRSALRKARLSLDAVLLFLRGRNPLGGVGPHAKTLGLFESHFGKAAGKQQQQESMSFALRNFVNMLSTADNPRPSVFGGTFANFLDIDPINFTVDKRGQTIFGYVRVRGSKDARLDAAAIDPTKIYLTAAMDGQSRDKFLLLGLHELAHLSSNQGPSVFLDDHAYGFQPKYATISHTLRLRNADSYANFAFENAFGNNRLAAVVPQLKTTEIP